MRGGTVAKQVLVVALVAMLALVYAGAALADPRYEVMNAPEGVYWRSEPNWAAAERISGFGVYNGTIVEVHCYQSGTSVEGSADTMWEHATDVGGSGYGSGWLNEHFINDGQPINQPSPGVPPCSAPPPPPPPGLIFTVFNAEGGIYYRNSPHWGDTSAIPGVGVYNGDAVELICGAFGDPVGPYSDTAWSYVRNLSRSVGDGWVNEHFINDGALSNQFVAGEPACGAGTPGITTPSGVETVTPPSGGSPPPSAAVYFSPFGHGKYEAGYGTITLPVGTWGSQCVLPHLAASAAIAAVSPGQMISTVAGWSYGRVGVVSFLANVSTQQKQQVNYGILIDPGKYDELGCDRFLHAGSVLASWLNANPSARLVVISGSLSQNDRSRGIQETYFNAIRRNSDRSRVLTCNYSISHTNAFLGARYWIAHHIGASTRSCPWLSAGGRQYKPTAAWHP